MYQESIWEGYISSFSYHINHKITFVKGDVACLSYSSSGTMVICELDGLRVVVQGWGKGLQMFCPSGT